MERAVRPGAQPYGPAGQELIVILSSAARRLYTTHFAE
jgi:hypothetical protein